VPDIPFTIALLVFVCGLFLGLLSALAILRR
jgi:hypothetical protein